MWRKARASPIKPDAVAAGNVGKILGLIDQKGFALLV
jgi:nucleoside diphosphate kinase